ncbi:hypothetical protein DU508_14755 [Pedobacter chinensis]|uniref:Carboxypeptidase-like regulatory domain-containing protein n=1 Tax=Pedobacter chinensis TaxID=2282421 RepID=A0A369PSC9_9SPHI|nr:carboxypeptidase-like regulatory domain-containing protein [Pedobacter chinensis]RDC55541.1 hypothetical protein DU508_14755 [Pedobacter chinensis]
MKNSQAQITIAEPCSQNWDEMDKREGFNFCQACNKCVIDFTGYSNAEIIKTLASSSSEICGRLTQNQLTQLNYHLVIAPANRNWMKYLGVLAIGVSIFAQSASAQAIKPSVVTTVSKKLKSDEKKPFKIKKITGRILDADKKPLEGIRLVILNTRYYAVTDQDGKYEIRFTNGIDIKNKALSVKSIRYSAEMPINYSAEKQQDLILEKQDSMIMGKMIYTPKKNDAKL